jgi:hypothetical protein
MLLFRHWMFWLPASYVLVLVVAWLDMWLHLSGDGESNAGAWLYLLSFLPSYLVGEFLGGKVGFPISPATQPLFICVQLIGYLVIGLVMDVLYSRFLKTD